jgi:hypothetical protein
MFLDFFEVSHSCTQERCAALFDEEISQEICSLRNSNAEMQMFSYKNYVKIPEPDGFR